MASQQTITSTRGGYADGLITEAMIEQFETVGAVKVPGLLDEYWIEQLRGEMDTILADAEAHSNDRLGNTDMLEKNETFKRLLFESPLAQAAATVMQSTVARYYEDLLIYVPQGLPDENPAWHQDAPYWPLTGRQLTNVWFSLEKVTRTTGAIRVIAGSHHGPNYLSAQVNPESLSKDRLNSSFWSGGPLPDIDADPERFPQVALETEPGDVVIFHPSCLHIGVGSPVAGPRRTFTVRMMGDDVRWHPRRSHYHEWMKDLPFAKGDIPDHPRLPLLWPR